MDFLSQHGASCGKPDSDHAISNIIVDLINYVNLAVHDEKSKVKGYALCKEYEGKDKICYEDISRSSAGKLYPDNTGIEEVIWTDEPSSEFLK